MIIITLEQIEAERERRERAFNFMEGNYVELYYDGPECIAVIEIAGKAYLATSIGPVEAIEALQVKVSDIPGRRGH
jgi:hypothetical protein